MFSNFDVKKLKKFDRYHKPLDDVRIRTLSGGMVTVVAGVIMSILFFNELRYYMKTNVNQEIVVDASHEDIIPIHIDIIFHRMGCMLLTMDTMTSTGHHHLAVDHDLSHTRLDEHGRPMEAPAKYSTVQPPASAIEKRKQPDYCGSCYGAEATEHKCCNTCEQVRVAYQARGWVITDLSVIEQCRDEGMPEMLASAEREGCRFNGTVMVEKVMGSFHFAPGKSYQAGRGSIHVHDVGSMLNKNYNMSHTILKLAFGASYPSLVNPLDGTAVLSDEMSERYTYHVKIVPTSYTGLDQKTLISNQFSVTKERKTFNLGGGVPGFFVSYEFSAIAVRLTEFQRSLFHFLTNVCAIVGGVFTVFSLVDAGLYQVSKLKVVE